MPVFICQGCGTEHTSWSGKCPHCGVSETIQLKQSTDRMLEKVIKGKYKIVRKLGQGGMGAVYLAEQLGIGHRVALKFLKSEFSEDAEIARRFLNEAKSYARVAHPNAVTLHDFGQDEEGNLFIAMEYCEGVDLKKILHEQKRIPLGEAIDIILQVADVLGNAHSKHVVHRDLKPENIMLRKGMRGLHVKVLDFGIARLMNEGTKLTMQGAIAGTPRYMAPEQVEGRDDVDHRADIYAVGILLYEMLTGVQPFDGNTITEILRNQVVQPMPRLGDVSPDLENAEVEAVLQKACAKNRNERFPDMQAFASQIAQAMPTQAGRAGTGVWAGMPSPSSEPTTAHVAVPGANATDPEREASTLQATFVRSGTEIQHPLPKIGLATPPPKAPSQPKLRPLEQPNGLSFGGINPSNSTVVATEGHVSEIRPPAPSRTPMIAALVALVALGGGAAWFFTRPTVDPNLLVPPPVITEPVVEGVKPPVVPEVKNPSGLDEAGIARSRDALARASAPFEVGNLDEAEIFLKSVEATTPSRAAADAMQQKIDTIREKVKRGQGAVAAGNCDVATTNFREALRINPRIQGALDGLNRCKNAALPTQLDP